MTEVVLTSSQQDYLETVFRITGSRQAGARITDIAAMLRTKAPTVVRSVARLRTLGYFTQKGRLVHLSKLGEKVAAQLAHRHTDVYSFLIDVLGVSEERAESDACLIEHGLSAHSSQCLHRFLERWYELPKRIRKKLKGQDDEREVKHFELVGNVVAPGARK